MAVTTTYTPGEQLTAQDLNASFAECAAVGGPNTFTGTQSFAAPIQITTASTVLNGTSAGSIDWLQPEQGTNKKFVSVASGYENDTTVAQTITFPVAFTYPPAVSVNTTGLTVSVTTTTLTITAPNATTIFNGVLIVEGI